MSTLVHSFWECVVRCRSMMSMMSACTMRSIAEADCRRYIETDLRHELLLQRRAVHDGGIPLRHHLQQLRLRFLLLHSLHQK